MFPKEIIDILQKYQGDNSEILSSINNHISVIIESLYTVNENLAEQVKNLVLDKDTNNNAKEIFMDSKTLRDYIKTIRLLEIEQKLLNDSSAEISEELSLDLYIMPKPVKLYLCEDSVCPLCGCLMEETHTSFTENKLAII